MNQRRMEVMLEDLSENFDRHVSLAAENNYFVMTGSSGESKLKLRAYSQGIEAELEILAFALGESEPTFKIYVDGELVDEREGVITIGELSLARGWRVLEIEGKCVKAGRVRIKGNLNNIYEEKL